jgi:hypothetical protein
MSRFFIVGTAGSTVGRTATFTNSTCGEGAAQSAGCAWLFSAEAVVDDAEAALRDAVMAFFGSDEGRRVREGEELVSLSWEEAIPWVPDRVWREHGLTAIRHPEVERILLDRDEDLAEELAAGQQRSERRARR